MAEDRKLETQEADVVIASKLSTISSIIWQDLQNQNYILERNESSTAININIYDTISLRNSMYSKRGNLLATIKINEKQNSVSLSIENFNSSNINLSEILSNNAIRRIKQIDMTIPLVVTSSISCSSNK
jgi:hypothetical protein